VQSKTPLNRVLNDVMLVPATAKMLHLVVLPTCTNALQSGASDNFAQARGWPHLADIWLYQCG
jgi:hypothetical protein